MDANEMQAYRGLSPYEVMRISDKNSRHPSGVAITGLVLGSLGLVGAVGAWIFGPYSASQRARGIEMVVANNNQNTQATLDRLINALYAERNERVAQGTTISQTINDTISGQQTSQLTAQQAAELSSVQSVQNQLFTQAVMGNLSENAQKVQIYSAPQPCGCPGCGCNG